MEGDKKDVNGREAEKMVVGGGRGGKEEGKIIQGVRKLERAGKGTE